MARPLSLIGSPSSAGAYAAGQEKAPAAFRTHGLIEALGSKGRQIVDRGDGPHFRWRPDASRPHAMNLEAVRDAAGTVADAVELALRDDHCALVMGGDCTAELGVVAGALRNTENIGLVYIDFDVDLNAPAESDGALDWTGVAHLLDLPGAEPSLAGLGPRRAMLSPDDVLFFAAENVTPSEEATMSRLGLTRIARDEVKADPTAAGRRAAEWGQRFDICLVHLDADVLTYLDFPIAENTRRCEGLSLDELSVALREITRAANWRTLTLAEFNPDHAPDEAQAFARLIGMLKDALA